MTTITQCPSGCITYGQMNLINDFRSLWAEIAVWSRSFMASTISNSSDIKAVNNRLYKITESFKDKLQPFFGVKVAEEIHQLFLAYIINIQTMVTALYNKDPLTVDTAVTSLYRISDEIADYMASINPYWERSKWQSFLYKMNERLIAQTIALIGGEYEKEIDIRDNILRHALQLGDYTAEGVINYLVPEDLPEDLPENLPLEYPPLEIPQELPTGPAAEVREFL